MFVTPVASEAHAARNPFIEDPSESRVFEAGVSSRLNGLSQFPALLNFSKGVNELIEKLKWENDRLLLSPRNSSPIQEEDFNSSTVLDELASLQTQISSLPGLALGAQATASPETVLSLVNP